MNPPSAAGSSITRQESTGLHGSACDTCRRRRVKCNGSQPCDRCTRSNVSCTYGSVSGRVSAISYARHLEQKIAELQSLLNQQSEEQDAATPDSQKTAQGQMLDMLIGLGDGYIYRLPETCSNVFYGGFGGFSALRLVSSAGLNWSNMASGTRSPTRDFVEAFETTSLFPPTGLETQIPMVLPSKQRVQSLVAHASRTALACHDCLDFDDFEVKLDRLYEIEPENYEPKDRSFVILVYALIALGRRYMPSTEEDELDDHKDTVKFRGYDLLLRGSSYDLDAIRAVICHVRYFSSMSMISKAYSHTCVGISTALRMGLHISGRQMRSAFTGEELYQRRKVFATLNMMDIYLSSALGMPNILKDADHEQTLSLPEDELHDGGASFIRRNPTTIVAETVLCQEVNLILAKILDSRYDLGRKPEQSSSEPEGACNEEHDWVTAREAELEHWHNSLPALHEDPSDKRALQAQLTIRLWHSLAQIVLYRPFLHYLARNGQDPKFNIYGYECASSCVSAAMQAIWVIKAINTNDLLHEGYWLYMYMLGYAASILIFFVSSSVQKATLEESIASVIEAKGLLGLLAKYNLSARRCHDSLSVVMDTLALT